MHMSKSKSMSVIDRNAKRPHTSISNLCSQSPIKNKKLFKALPFDDDGENSQCQSVNPSTSSKTVPLIEAQTIRRTRSDLLNSPKGADNDSTTEVKLNKTWHRNPKLDYKMTSNPRGPCLIVNNVNFEGDMFPKRRGSDIDAHKLSDVFKQLGFQVQLERNLTSHKMKSFFMQASASCKHKYDALVVILLSHGTESAIYGTDGIEMDLNDIISLFDNKRCKPMIGKPKLFIVQACRGRIADYGVKKHDISLFHSQPDSPPQSQYSQLCQSIPTSPKISRLAELDEKFQPTRTDMLLCFSCNPGFVSVRNEDAGSWLCMYLSMHLRKHSCTNHFMEIINMVSQDVRQRISAEGHKQVIEITWIGFDKNLYFNPGLYVTL